MKIRTALTVLCAAAAFTLTSCGGDESSEVRPYTPPTTAAVTTQSTTQPTTEATTVADFHERHDYEDGVLVGHWIGDTADLYIQEDGMLSADFDISELMMFSSDGAFMLSGEKYPKENVQYDGATLTVVADSGEDSEASEPVEIISLVRIGDPVPDEIDGRYTFASEKLKESLVSAIVGTEEDIDITMLIRNGHCIISVSNFCSYTQKGDELTLSGTLLDFGGMGGDCTFVLDGDTCTIYDSNGVTDEFVKHPDEPEPETTEAE